MTENFNEYNFYLYNNFNNDDINSEDQIIDDEDYEMDTVEDILYMPIKDLRDFEYIRKNQNIINWDELSTMYNLREDFMYEFKDKLIWEKISLYQKMSEPFMISMKEYLDWTSICKYINLSKRLILECKDYIDWDIFCDIGDKLLKDEDFIREVKDYVIWENILNNAYSDYFLEEHKQYINLEDITDFSKVGYEFIEKYKDNLDWYHILRTKLFTEDKIKEYKNYINWDSVCLYQELSEDFIEYLIDINKIDWFKISCGQILSENQILKYKYRLNLQYYFNKVGLILEDVNKKENKHELDNIYNYSKKLRNKIKKYSFSLFKECHHNIDLIDLKLIVKYRMELLMITSLSRQINLPEDMEYVISTYI